MKYLRYIKYYTKIVFIDFFRLPKWSMTNEGLEIPNILLPSCKSALILSIHPRHVTE